MSSEVKIGRDSDCVNGLLIGSFLIISHLHDHVYRGLQDVGYLFLANFNEALKDCFL